jgi:hypothetical protein
LAFNDDFVFCPLIKLIYFFLVLNQDALEKFSVSVSKKLTPHRWLDLSKHIARWQVNEHIKFN